MSAPHRHRSRWKSLQPWALVWLTVLWVALWGDVSIANVVAGIVVGTVVCLAFPLPPLRMHLRIRPHWLAWLVVQARRSTHTLFLHVLDARDEDGVEKMRREVMALERRVVLAFGADTAPVLEPEPLPVGPHDREEEAP